MTVETLAGAKPDAEDEARAPARSPFEARVASALLALLPGALIVFFGFRGGGFFPGAVGFAGLIVVQALLLRVLVAADPLAGVSRPFAIVGGLFAAFAGWVLASSLWTDAADRPLTEFNRVLLYLLVFVLMGLLPRRAWRAPWLVRSTMAGAFVICGVGLISRVLPHLLPTAPGVSNNRLSYPVTYWNALGLVATIGALLAIGLTSTDREPRWVRSVAAAAVPVFAATLWFTFSRGAMVALILGLLAFLVVARQRALVGGLVATLPTTAVALLFSYNADQLSTTNPTTAAAVAQGKDVALAVTVCAVVAAVLRALLIPLDRRLARISLEQRTRRVISIAGGGSAVVVIGIVLVAGGAAWIGDQFDRFLAGQATVETGDLRARLSDPSSNGRTDHWNAAFDGFSEEPLHGKGAGTYQFTWEKHRPADANYPVMDAHGLYFETLSDLGAVGLLLLVAVILSILTALARRAQGPNRGYWAALFGAAVAWAAHAGVDWDWEMPVVTAWMFAVGGAALGSAAVSSGSATMTRRFRVTAGAGLLVTAVMPVLMMLGHSHLSRAADAFRHNNCNLARDQAFAAMSRVAVRPEPYQIIGYCDLEDGRTKAAVAAMQEAVERQPSSWEYHFGLALALGESGDDPMPELRAALARNPHEPILRDAQAELSKRRPGTEQIYAIGRLRVRFEESNRLSLK